MKIMSDFKLVQGPDVSGSPSTDVIPAPAIPSGQTRLTRSWIYETLFARGRIGEDLRETLAWYDTIRSLSRFGPFRISFSTMTSRGVPYSAIPASDWQRQAQSDFHWAQNAVPPKQRELFDGLIDGTLQIAMVGKRWPTMPASEARDHAEKQFLIAANFLLAFAGSRRGASTAAA